MYMLTMEYICKNGVKNIRKNIYFYAYCMCMLIMDIIYNIDVISRLTMLIIEYMWIIYSIYSYIKHTWITNV